MSRGLRIAGIGLILIMLLAGCQGIAPKAAEAAPTAIQPTEERQPVLKVAVDSPLEEFDPRKAASQAEKGALRLIYEGLTRLDENLNPAPGAAQSWAFSTDGKEVTFTLRPNLTYSDGSPINAKRFETLLLSHLPRGETSGSVKGSPVDWEALRNVASIQAQDRAGVACASEDQPDCLGLRLVLKQADMEILSVLASPLGYPVKEPDSGNDLPVGNGPFVLERLAGGEAVFAPNPLYWRGTPLYRVEVTRYENFEAALAAYQQGEVSILPVPPANWWAVQEDKALAKQSLKVAVSCVQALALRVKPTAPFEERAVRQAFALATDRAGWVDNGEGGMGIPALSWIPPGYPAYDRSETNWGFSPELARLRLEDSTYRGTDTMPEMTIAFEDHPEMRARFEWLANQWSLVLNARITLLPLDREGYAAAFTSTFANERTAPAAIYFTWCAENADPSAWLRPFLPGGALEGLGYNDLEVQNFMRQAAGETDAAARLELYLQAQKRVIETAPVIVLNTSARGYLIQPRLKGLRPTPLDGLFPGEGEPLVVRVR